MSQLAGIATVKQVNDQYKYGVPWFTAISPKPAEDDNSRYQSVLSAD